MKKRILAMIFVLALCFCTVIPVLRWMRTAL